MRAERHTTIPVRAGMLALLVAGCGGSSSTSSLPPGYYIAISNLSYAPLNLDVPPGATVTVINKDAMPHSVTSETSSGQFTPGAVAGVSFDTGAFSGQKSFTVGTAPEGTVVPYYCSVHRSTMATPNGTITIRAGAQPGPAP